MPGRPPCTGSTKKNPSLRKRTEFENGAWALVSVDLSKLNDKSVRINVTIHKRRLRSIDHHVVAIGESRPGFLTRAAISTMAAEHV